MSIPLSLSDWMGKDEWQEKHGLDPLIKIGIISVLNEINKDRSEQARSASKQKQVKSADLKFPQPVYTATTRYK